MKGLLLYLAVMAGGGVVGAVGVGAYNVFVVGVESEALAEGEGEEGAEGAESEQHAENEGESQVTEVDPDTTGTESDDPETDVAVAAGEGTGTGALAVGDSTAADPAVPVAETDPVAIPDEPEVDPEEEARLQANYQRLARIFMAMNPEEAAPVLAQLEDSQLEGILLAMQSRNAAPILAEMDPARVASISRRVLGGNE